MRDEKLCCFDIYEISIFESCSLMIIMPIKKKIKLSISVPYFNLNQLRIKIRFESEAFIHESGKKHDNCFKLFWLKPIHMYSKTYIIIGHILVSSLMINIIINI